ncbi:hypothetical protein [uncultured Corynebacterium sp.]|uniref:hypothetical protein n=1 Tax=uncultured Corynebacterium sp. TaxID=159447 RepID=UPI0025954C4D|nr:hypothetical protein [uncultured Corynebacterium sp.]
MAEQHETRDLWNIALENLTDTQLEEHQLQCWDRSNNIDQERQRRRALPYVWENETQIVKSLRAALNNAPKAGAPWKQPENITGAYIDGDIVTHEKKTWKATGDGAIMFAPTEVHPIMGQRWVPAAGQDAETN